MAETLKDGHPQTPGDSPQSQEEECPLPSATSAIEDLIKIQQNDRMGINDCFTLLSEFFSHFNAM